MALKQETLHVWDVGTQTVDFVNSGIEAGSKLKNKLVDQYKNQHPDEKDK